MMGEESVAQVFLGIIICAFWMSLLIHKKPYKAGWDNIIAVILAAHLLLTLVSGMALKLYDATPGQDEYQKAGFGAVLIAVSECFMRMVLGLGSIVVKYAMFEREGHEVFETRVLARCVNGTKELYVLARSIFL